jgi:transposase
MKVYRGKSFKKKMEVVVLHRGKEETQRIMVRYVVIHSSALERTHQRSLEKKIAQEKKVLEKALSELEKRRFSCQGDIDEALKSLEKTWPFCYHQIALTIEKGSQKEKRQSQGRPRKGEVVKKKSYWYLSGEVIPHEEAIATLKRKQGFFVLATSHLHPKKVSNAEILAWYKEQHQVEQGFHWLKGPASFAPIFLKKPERILAMGLVFLLALMVHTLIERQIRQELATRVEKIPGNNKVLTDRPTAAVVFKHFNSISVIWVYLDNQWKPVIPGLSKLQRYILELLHLPEEVFLRSKCVLGAT